MSGGGVLCWFGHTEGKESEMMTKQLYENMVWGTETEVVRSVCVVLGK